MIIAAVGGYVFFELFDELVRVRMAGIPVGLRACAKSGGGGLVFRGEYGPQDPGVADPFSRPALSSECLRYGLRARSSATGRGRHR